MEIKTKIMKSGNAYYFRVPKALLDCKVLDKEKEYTITVKPLDNGPIVQWTASLDPIYTLALKRARISQIISKG